MIGSGYSRLKNGDDSLHVASKHEASFIYWAERNVREGHTDMVGVGRQSIADPDFARKVLEGRLVDVNWFHLPGVHDALGANKRVGCTQYDKEYRALMPKVG